MSDETFDKELALNLLESADPEVCCQNSFLNYHAPGFHYLNLLRTERLTVKIYVNDETYTPLSFGWVVWPHNHQYNFHTFVLAGGIQHYWFEAAAAEGLGGQYTLFGLDHFKYRSPFAGGKGFEHAGRSDLTIVDQIRLSAGQSYYLKHDEIHTIGLDHTVPRTVLLLFQYEDKAKMHTDFFWNQSFPPDVKDLYQKMTPEQYQQLQKKVLSLIT